MKEMMQGFHKAHENFPQGGTCLEFGVFTGTSYMNQVNCIISTYKNTKLIGFDSWQGLPAETTGVWAPDRHAQGKFSTPKDAILNKLGHLINDKRFAIVDGFFKDSLTVELQKTIKDLIFVNIDVDIHSSTWDILNFIYPLLRPGVIIYFDDWKDPRDLHVGKWGEHLAWEEFIEMHSEIKYNTFVVNKLNQRCLEIE